MLGMHRSGTSMVTRCLHLAGLYLGPSSQLLDGSSGIGGSSVEDNPRGYWEHLGFIPLNDAVLEAHGGTFLHVPDLPAGYETAPELADVRRRAHDLIAEFDGHDPWGWKDPRNSVTIAFWKHLLPDLKVVVCVRSPLEVARSTFRRNLPTVTAGYHWWLRHYGHLDTELADVPTIVTHYETYLNDPRAEIERLAEFCGLEPGPDQVDEAAASVSADLHRRVMPHELVDDTTVPAPVADCYAALCARAGDVFWKAVDGTDRSGLVLDVARRLVSDETTARDQLETARRTLADQAPVVERVHRIEADNARLRREWSDMMARSTGYRLAAGRLEAQRQGQLNQLFTLKLEVRDLTAQRDDLRRRLADLVARSVPPPPPDPPPPPPAGSAADPDAPDPADPTPAWSVAATRATGLARRVGRRLRRAVRGDRT